MPSREYKIQVQPRANSLIDTLKATARHFSIGELELQPHSEQHYLQTLDIKQNLNILKEKSNEFKDNLRGGNTEILNKLITEITKLTVDLNLDIERIDCDGSPDRLRTTEGIIDPYKLVLDGLTDALSNIQSLGLTNKNNKNPSTTTDFDAFTHHLKETESNLIQIRNGKRFDVANQTQLQWVKQQLEAKTPQSHFKLILFVLIILVVFIALVVYLKWYNKQFNFESSFTANYKKVVGPPVPLKPIGFKHH
ncbi:unnamed protein product [Ambrosiozyma monospora]|uniref:Unnamed protein product n=1 Tax=Ambrosiozyma monospora TaxID=43982 RepID=A0A9W7DFA1_AMBMO|nr:unnamed protein product [Ambrosiozyma monospora]